MCVSAFLVIVVIVRVTKLKLNGTGRIGLRWDGGDEEGSEEDSAII